MAQPRTRESFSFVDMPSSSESKNFLGELEKLREEYKREKWRKNYYKAETKKQVLENEILRKELETLRFQLEQSQTENQQHSQFWAKLPEKLFEFSSQLNSQFQAEMFNFKVHRLESQKLESFKSKQQLQINVNQLEVQEILKNENLIREIILKMQTNKTGIRLNSSKSIKRKYKVNRVIRRKGKIFTWRSAKFWITENLLVSEDDATLLFTESCIARGIAALLPQVTTM
jgi:hypothetical protein